MIDEKVVLDALAGLASGDWDREDCALNGAWVQHAQDAGYSSSVDGFVVHIPGGGRFLVSVQLVRE